MAIYFNSNQLASFSASNSASTEVLTAGTFYSGTAASSMSIPLCAFNSLSDYISARIGIDATSVTSLYDSSDHYFTANVSIISVFPARWEAVNSTEQVVARIRSSANTTSNLVFEYFNGATFTQAGPTFNYSLNTLQTLNVRITCGAAGSVDIWLGAWGAQTLVCSIPATSGLNAAVNNIASVRHGNPTPALGYISSVAITDYDLRARRWIYSRANGAGAFNDGTGLFSDTNSFPRDLTKSRVLTLSGNKFSMTKAAVAFPGTLTCEAVLINAAMRSTGGVVTNARHGVSIGGVWYPMSLVNPVPNGGYEIRAGYFSTNPATGAVFTSADVNGLQFGTEART